ncbi:DHH family phosphoesterase [candidate division KSB1 bacterium]|nr:DHH family phosphoesterase [candidate division KSB1 bacterium]
MENILKILSQWNDEIILTTHTNPDWDAIASLKCMSSILKRHQAHYQICWDGKLPAKASEILPEAQIAQSPEDAGTNKLLLILDTDDIKRVPVAFHEARFAKTIFIDHHHPVQQNTNGSIKFIDPQASSTSEILTAYLFDHPEYYDPANAIWLYLGMYSDTGGFRFSKTRAKTLQMASWLMNSIADLSLVDIYLYQDKEPADILFLRGFYGNIHFFFENQLASTAISLNEIKDLAAYLNSPSDNLDNLLQVREVKVAMMIRQLSENSCKVYLRSKPGFEVIQLLHALGGGGHPNAGGATLHIGLHEAEELMKEKIKSTILH